MPGSERSQRAHRIARLIAVVAGLAGIVLCGLVPLLPVKQTTATILWPQGPGTDGNVSDVTAPLVSGAPLALDVTIPCTAVATLPRSGGLVFSTIPAAGTDASKYGLFVRANADAVVVAFRDSVAAVAPRTAVAGGACSVLHIWANVGGVGADFVGIPGAAGTLPVEKKPQVAGLFTDLKVPPRDGLAARVDIDTRFITSPTLLKRAVMVLGVICVVAAIVALAALDLRSRRAGDMRLGSGRRPRGSLTRWLRVGFATWLADIGVVGTLLLWHVIGAISSDDGYNLTIARVSGQAGYVANYYRYFGTTEAPFDWYQSLLGQLASVSTAGVWMRLPATLAGIGCWLILSRCVLPRLGRALAANWVAVWTAGAVFLAAWLPFNNGLRPEPIIAFGTLLTWMLVENAIGTRRLWPAAVAIVVATFAATVAPQGLIALAPLLVGARAVARIIARRRADDGLLAPIAALLASLATDLRRRVPGPDAGDGRRVGAHQIRGGPDDRLVSGLPAVLLPDRRGQRRRVVDSSLRGVGVAAVPVRDDRGVLRRGRVPGAASGPVWRLIGTTAIGLLLLTFTPTKWAVQFGAFAGLAGALGAVTAFTFSRVGLHSRRNLALYVTALLFVLAWATSGLNGWFYVGNYGVPWFDKQPVIAGFPVTVIFLILAIATGVLAGWLHFRLDYTGHTEVTNNRRNRILASTPLLVVAIIMVVLEVGSMAYGAARRYPVYTTARANFDALASGLSKTSCAMADDVLVEPDTNAGLLQPVPGQRFGQYGPLGGESPVGFTPNGVGDKLEPVEPVTANPGTVNSDGSPNKPSVGIGYAAGTKGGYGPEGVNGSKVALAVRARPGPDPCDGQLQREHRRREGDLGVVPAAAANAGPAARGGGRRRSDLVARRGRQFQLRSVSAAGVGGTAARRQLPAALDRGADRRRVGRRPAAEGMAQPDVPASLGAAGGQRRAHRRV